MIDLISKETEEAEQKRKIGVNSAVRITIDFFKTLLEKRPNVTLEEAIHEFENVDSNSSLESFALRHGRTLQGYLNTYRDMFNTAHREMEYDLCG